MCPITLPNQERIWLHAIEALTELRGLGKFSALDVQEFIDARNDAA